MYTRLLFHVRSLRGPVRHVAARPAIALQAPQLAGGVESPPARPHGRGAQRQRVTGVACAALDPVNGASSRLDQSSTGRNFDRSSVGARPRVAAFRTRCRAGSDYSQATRRIETRRPGRSSAGPYRFRHRDWRDPHPASRIGSRLLVTVRGWTVPFRLQREVEIFHSPLRDLAPAVHPSRRSRVTPGTLDLDLRFVVAIVFE